jgi:hypothetical protein
MLYVRICGASFVIGWCVVMYYSVKAAWLRNPGVSFARALNLLVLCFSPASYSEAGQVARRRALYWFTGSAVVTVGAALLGKFLGA